MPAEEPTHGVTVTGVKERQSRGELVASIIAERGLPLFGKDGMRLWDLSTRT